MKIVRDGGCEESSVSNISAIQMGGPEFVSSVPKTRTDMANLSYIPRPDRKTGEFLKLTGQPTYQN